MTADLTKFRPSRAAVGWRMPAARLVTGDPRAAGFPLMTDLSARLKAKSYAPVSDAGLRRNMGVPTIMLDPDPLPDYAFPQVLITPIPAEPRSDNAVFLCPFDFASMGDAPIRKDGGLTGIGLSTSPTRALISADEVSTRSTL